ncbi:protein CIMAP1C-like isoform X2 [Bacillus rossius redtenbacheri]|uniref:protein CIMAP1C-like isoform X2 n=1 Tax=Bacillus rossius redtenbacheri TaxID=93214 RepID=UPI002FDD5BD9
MDEKAEVERETPREKMIRSKGPGPKYLLPSTVGYVKHDGTRYRNPAWSMGHRLDTRRGYVTPGPKYKPADNVTRFGSNKPAGITMGSRLEHARACGWTRRSAAAARQAPRATPPRPPRSPRPGPRPTPWATASRRRAPGRWTPASSTRATTRGSGPPLSRSARATPSSATRCVCPPTTTTPPRARRARWTWGRRARPRRRRRCRSRPAPAEVRASIGTPPPSLSTHPLPLSTHNPSLDTPLL